LNLYTPGPTCQPRLCLPCHASRRVTSLLAACHSAAGPAAAPPVPGASNPPQLSLHPLTAVSRARLFKPPLPPPLGSFLHTMDRALLSIPSSLKHQTTTPPHPTVTQCTPQPPDHCFCVGVRASATVVRSPVSAAALAPLL
jgi:hypothetical protein